MGERNGKIRKIAVIACSGNGFKVDASDEACRKFGFKYGDRVVEISTKKEGVVMGVARMFEWANHGIEVLWIAIDGDHGKVSSNILMTHHERIFTLA